MNSRKTELDIITLRFKIDNYRKLSLNVKTGGPRVFSDLRVDTTSVGVVP